MSKESKSRDRWRQLDASSADRPKSFCSGCGYHRVVTGKHRADCTAPQPETGAST
ncbi:hypothetical protein [Mycolicibacterium canariasense]|uniref:hypothetical protein n=1 Tax=Mycolicibacterium canariasense TaxID=228230 RepID=UPI000AD9D7D8|nr:hypothetical protein [Mycolicibacterium canariasense]MCV7208824.1 hypothetical protein [Mycolicibacterium canariasense]